MFLDNSRPQPAQQTNFTTFARWCVLAVEFQFWSHVSSSWLPDPPFMGIPKAIEMNILYENDELQSHIFKIL